MQNTLEDDDMIKINKKKFLIAALMLLLTGVLIGQGMVQAKSDTYEELKSVHAVARARQAQLCGRPQLEGADPGSHSWNDIKP